MPEIMTVQEMAKYLKFHQITIKKYAVEGVIPAFRIGRSWRFDKEAVDQWISEGKNKPSTVKKPKLKATKTKPKRITPKSKSVKKPSTKKTPVKKKGLKAKPIKKTVDNRTKKIIETKTVLTIINKSRKGIDTATLKSKTGYEGREINDIVYRLKRAGKIKSGGRGIYVKT